MKKHIPFLLILATGIALRIFWWTQTGFTEEDAHITFQFARQVALWNEFSFNTGQPIYGSTTPLLTFLLSAWYAFNTDLALGAKVLSLLAFAGGLIFLHLSVRGLAGFFAALLISTSSLLIVQDMSGMEMALLFFFMMGALRGMTMKEEVLSGLMCAFLLLTRIDSVVFVAVMALAHYLENKSVAKFLLGASAYTFWFLFAWWYFGSPIPFTITAKSVAYGINTVPFSTHLYRIAEYLSIPLTLSICIVFILIKRRRTIFLPLFVVLQTLFLASTGSTFFPRYFYMLTVISLVAIGMAIPKTKSIPAMIAITMLVTVFSFRTNWISFYSEKQEGRFALLQEIGIWFNQNTPKGSTVQLEPLGYVGYYSQRVMLDEVGLITPDVVNLHRNGIGAENFWRYLRTDYILYQCHQADGVLDDFQKEYHLIRVFDRGEFRTCYEVWAHG